MKSSADKKEDVTVTIFFFELLSSLLSFVPSPGKLLVAAAASTTGTFFVFQKYLHAQSKKAQNPLPLSLFFCANGSQTGCALALARPRKAKIAIRPGGKRHVSGHFLVEAAATAAAANAAAFFPAALAPLSTPDPPQCSRPIVAANQTWLLANKRSPVGPIARRQTRRCTLEGHVDGNEKTH